MPETYLCVPSLSCCSVQYKQQMQGLRLGSNNVYSLGLQGVMSRRRRTAISEEERAVDACLKGEDIEGFRLGFIDEFIGSGVFCEKRFKKGDFLLEYQGELISQEEGEHREANYPEDKGSFLYFFCHNGKTKCIDATDSCGNGRMVNDGTNMANCKMRIVSLEGVPKLCLFALKDIEKGSELRCDYGVSDLPWRKREQIQMETNKVPQESSSEQSVYEVDTQENNGRFANLVEKDLIHRNDLVQKSCKMPSEEKAKNLTHYPEENRDSSEVFQQLSEASTSKTINKEANIIAGESKQPPRYKKPSRKCPFCGSITKKTNQTHQACPQG
ncbi:putative histone-lysine N-methyltransferase pr-set7-like [Apostichopus japonicus]|uniref:Putative histone-lysine N-methyltransferase pr-set7-like n=1 Tax=Stichopus japonicus TaxID=307972 RepID=A0A2G8LFQ2_STIJA|nr:putative histone-lysine N-methyltransferase pr-set7-like [Apostichopus japonicus]